MNQTWYLLDNNALVTLSREERSREFVRQRCRIPTEVLHEAEGYPDIALLCQLEFEMNADILTCIRQVMAAESPGDFRLVDLYGNKGNADPILIATALYARALGGDAPSRRMGRGHQRPCRPQNRGRVHRADADLGAVPRLAVDACDSSVGDARSSRLRPRQGPPLAAWPSAGICRLASGTDLRHCRRGGTAVARDEDPRWD